MADSLGKYIIEQGKKLKSDRHNWEDHWWDVTQYTLPRKKDIWLMNVSGEKKNVNVYDAAPIHYNELLASALHSMLTNPSTNWFLLRAREQSIQKLQAVRQYLQTTTDKIHQFINNSNFHSEIHELYLDLGSLGTGVIRALDDKEDVFRFRSRPIYAYWIKEDHRGVVDTIYTEDKLTVRQILQRYGENSLPKDKIQEINKDKDKTLTVIHAIFPSSELKYVEGKHVIKKPLASIHVLKEYQHTLKKDGFRTMPYSVPRWHKLSDEIYGRSPGMKALPDIRMLNMMKRDTIRAAQKRTDPPTLVPDDSSFGPVDLRPGGITYYRAGTKDKPEPMNIGANPGIGLEIMADVREQIRQAFFVDQLQLKDGPQMTATEVNARVDEHLRLLGPVLGRLHNELLQPLIARLVDIMKITGNLPKDMPAELAETDLEVVFTSQIAKAQLISEGQKLDRMFGQLAPLVQISPSIVDNFNFDSIVDYIVDINGIPQKIMNTTEKVDEMRSNRQKQEQAAQQQQEQLVNAETASKVSKLV